MAARGAGAAGGHAGDWVPPDRCARWDAHDARHCRRGDRVMKRRKFIKLLGGAAAAGSVFWPLVALTEASSKRPTIAWIAPGGREVGASFIESFLRGMREFGYV